MSALTAKPSYSAFNAASAYATSLEMHYPMLEGCGTRVADLSGHGRNGVKGSTAVWDRNAAGYMLTMAEANANDKVTLPAGRILSGQPDWTFAAMVKDTSTSTGRHIYNERAGNNILGFNTNDGSGSGPIFSFQVLIRSDDGVLYRALSSSVSIRNADCLCVATKTGTTLTIYVLADGVQDIVTDAAITSGNTFTQTPTPVIGYSAPNGTGWTGNIYGISGWSRCLSQAEVLALWPDPLVMTRPTVSYSISSAPATIKGSAAVGNLVYGKRSILQRLVYGNSRIATRGDSTATGDATPGGVLGLLARYWKWPVAGIGHWARNLSTGGGGTIGYPWGSAAENIGAISGKTTALEFDHGEQLNASGPGASATTNSPLASGESGTGCGMRQETSYTGTAFSAQSNNYDNRVLNIFLRKNLSRYLLAGNKALNQAITLRMCWWKHPHGVGTLNLRPYDNYTDATHFGTFGTAITGQTARDTTTGGSWGSYDVPLGTYSDETKQPGVIAYHTNTDTITAGDSLIFPGCVFDWSNGGANKGTMFHQTHREGYRHRYWLSEGVSAANYEGKLFDLWGIDTIFMFWPGYNDCYSEGGYFTNGDFANITTTAALRDYYAQTIERMKTSPNGTQRDFVLLTPHDMPGTYSAGSLTASQIRDVIYDIAYSYPDRAVVLDLFSALQDHNFLTYSNWWGPAFIDSQGVHPQTPLCDQMARSIVDMIWNDVQGPASPMRGRALPPQRANAGMFP